MAGLEVEGVERTGPTFDGVVVGHVLDVQPHPGADRLRVCQVDTGAGAPVQIVCGAPNVAAGQTVPVATVGTVLRLPSRETPGETAEITIKKSKIRGETSRGHDLRRGRAGHRDRPRRHPRPRRRRPRDARPARPSPTTSTPAARAAATPCWTST